MGHTPGPWTVVNGTAVAPAWAPNERVAVTWAVNLRENEDGSYPEYGEWQHADARLIAAAPDLLAACQTVAHDLQAALDGDDFSGMSDADLLRAFLNVLRPAIAKAEGTPAWDASMDGPTSE